MTILFSIDPGKSGAIARFQFDSSSFKLIELIDTPMIGKEYNYYEIVDILKTQQTPSATSLYPFPLLGQLTPLHQISLGFAQ